MSPLIFQQGYQFILALKMSRCCEYQKCNFEIDCQVLYNFNFNLILYNFF